MGAKTYKPFVKADIDGFLALFIDNLANILILATVLTGVIKMPHEIVYGRVIPGFTLAVFVGSVFYYFQAIRTAKQTGNMHMAALPFGAPTSALFGFLYSIILPVYLISGDPMVAWRAGVAGCFINGVIETLGAFFGNTLRKVTPRAALFGSLAGLAIAFIALKPTISIFSNPVVGFLPMAIILLVLIGKAKLPKNLPVGLIAIVVGAAIGWIGGFMDPKAVAEGVSNIGVYFTIPVIGEMIGGFKDVLPYLAVIIPLAFHNFLSTMQNVESAAAVGDIYDTKSTMLVDGLTSILGACFGSVLPTTVYAGHPGYKAMGAHSGYVLMTGCVLEIIGLTGLVALIKTLMPVESVYGILLYVGLIMVAQAFATVEKKHYTAVAFALLPHIANYAMSQDSNAVQAMGGKTTDPEVLSALAGKSVDFNGLTVLGSGNTMSAMLIAAIVCFMIDHDWKKASGWAAASAVLSFFGFIHAGKIAVGAATGVAVGYLLLAILMLCYASFAGKKQTQPTVVE